MKGFIAFKGSKIQRFKDVVFIEYKLYCIMVTKTKV